MDFEEDEVQRPEYTGPTRRSPHDDDMNEIHFNEKVRGRIFFAAYSVSIFIILIVLSLVAALIILKKKSVGSIMIGKYDASPDVVAALNAI